MRPLCFLPVCILAACDCCGEPPTVDTQPPDSPADTQPPTDTGDTASDSLPAPVSDLAATFHDDVSTILEVSWNQDEPVDEAWVEYRFESDDWLSTPVNGWEAGEAS